MSRQKVLRWVEPLFPVLVVALGVLLAPALFLSGASNADERSGFPAVAKLGDRFVGHPIVVEDQYQGCNVDGHAYSARVVPFWRCGKDSFAPEPVRDVASLPSTEVVH